MPRMSPEGRQFIWATFFLILVLALILCVSGAAGQSRLPAPDSLLLSQIHEAADAHDIPRPIATALVRVESGFRPRAVSVAGAIGLTQVMPATGALVCGLRRASLFRVIENLNCGFSFLSALYVEKGTWYHALVAYHRGPARVKPGCCYVSNTSTDYALAVLRWATRAPSWTQTQLTVTRLAGVPPTN